jgi:hypothetical protein
MRQKRRHEAKELRAELRSEQERHLRTRADFDDYRRRLERDRAAAAGLDGMRHRLRSVLDAEGVKVGRGYLWNGKFFRPPRVRAAE